MDLQKLMDTTDPPSRLMDASIEKVVVFQMNPSLSRQQPIRAQYLRRSLCLNLAEPATRAEVAVAGTIMVLG